MNCISGKHSRTLFSSSSHRASNVLEVMHMDICGPINPQTLGGKRYFFLIAYDYSRCMWVSLIQEKLEALEQFKQFMVEVEKEVKMKCVRSDRGGEFIYEEFKILCNKCGMKRYLLHPILHNIMV